MSSDDKPHPTPRAQDARRNSRTLAYDPAGDVVLFEVAEKLERELAELTNDLDVRTDDLAVVLEMKRHQQARADKAEAAVSATLAPDIRELLIEARAWLDVAADSGIDSRDEMGLPTPNADRCHSLSTRIYNALMGIASSDSTAATK